MRKIGSIIVSLSLATGLSLAVTAGAMAAEERTVQQSGRASYYHDKHQGRKTASGQRFDQRKPTAASNSLPLGSKATVTNTQTGKSVDVEITDRMKSRRGVDLSKSAAAEIGLDRRQGTAPVKIEAKPSEQPTEQLKGAVEQRAANRRR